MSFLDKESGSPENEASLASKSSCQSNDALFEALHQDEQPGLIALEEKNYKIDEGLSI